MGHSAGSGLFGLWPCLLIRESSSKFQLLEGTSPLLLLRICLPRLTPCTPQHHQYLTRICAYLLADSPRDWSRTDTWPKGRGCPTFASACSLPCTAFEPCCTRRLMPVATSPAVSPGLSALSKMEDRKRSAIGSTDDLAPPSKRVAVNGSKAKDDPSEMKEEGWIEVRDCIHPGATVRFVLPRCRHGDITMFALAQHTCFLCQHGSRPGRGAAAWMLMLTKPVMILVAQRRQSAAPDPRLSRP